jgi:hypothetical protein
VQNCPVHGGGEREGDKENKSKQVFYTRSLIVLINTLIQPSTVGHASGPLRTPSVLKSTKSASENYSSLMKAERQKHNTHHDIVPSSKGEESRKINSFERGPGQWSFTGRRSKTSLGAQKDVRKGLEDPKASTMEFQRRWSLSGPSLTLSATSANIPISPQAQTVSSHSGALSRRIPEYFRVTSNNEDDKICQSLKKYPSQLDLHFNFNSSKLRKTPSSSSTSSIPSKVCTNTIQ